MKKAIRKSFVAKDSKKKIDKPKTEPVKGYIKDDGTHVKSYKRSK